MDYSVSEFGRIHCCKDGVQSKMNNRMAKSVDPDETARHEQSHRDRHCLEMYLFWFAGMNGIIGGSLSISAGFLRSRSLMNIRRYSRVDRTGGCERCVYLNVESMLSTNVPVSLSYVTMSVGRY